MDTTADRPESASDDEDEDAATDTAPLAVPIEAVAEPAKAPQKKKKMVIDDDDDEETDGVADVKAFEKESEKVPHKEEKPVAVVKSDAKATEAAATGAVADLAFRPDLAK